MIMDEIYENELLERLRNELNLDEVHITKSQLLQATEGSFFRARIELDMAFDKLKYELIEAMRLSL